MYFIALPRTFKITFCICSISPIMYSCCISCALTVNSCPLAFILFCTNSTTPSTISGILMLSSLRVSLPLSILLISKTSLTSSRRFFPEFSMTFRQSTVRPISSRFASAIPAIPIILFIGFSILSDIYERKSCFIVSACFAMVIAVFMASFVSFSCLFLSFIF